MLNDNGNILELVFNSIPDLIAVLNLDYKILRINKAMADKLGIKPEDAVGLTCYELVHETSQPPVFCPMSKLIEDGQTHKADVNEPKFGGFFMVTVNPIKSKTGKLLGCVHIASNITPLKLSEEKFITIFRHVPIPIAISTVSDGRFLDVNQAWEQLVGFNKDEVIGKSSVDLAFFDKMEDRVFLTNKLEKEGVVINERCKFRNRAGNLLFGLFSAARITIDGVDCWITSFNNTTEQIILVDAIREFEETIFSEARPQLVELIKKREGSIIE
jgi:PAS domain S-box-containing protein